MKQLRRNSSVRCLPAGLALCAALAGCQTNVRGSDASRLEGKLAAVQAIEVETARDLAEEGRALFEEDRAPLSGYQYCSVAVSLANAGEFRRSIRAASKALFLGEFDGDPYLSAHAHRDLAYAYRLAGHLNAAERHARQALRMMGRAFGRDPTPILGPAYKTLGDVALERGRPDEALRYYEAGLLDASERARPWLMSSISRAHLAAGRLVEARETLERASRLPAPGIRPYLLRGLGAIALAEKRFPDAEKFFDLAAAPGLEDQNYHRIWALFGAAKARRAQGATSASLDTMLEAIALAEQVRALFRSEEFRSGVFGNVQQLFDTAIDWLVEAGRNIDALEVSERSRARALLDLLRGRVALHHGTTVLSTGSATPRRVRDFVSEIPEGVAVVVFHLTEREAHAWVLRRNGIAAVALVAHPTQLISEARQLRSSIFEGPAASEPRFRSLYAKLVAPLALNPGEAVVIVPHGPLHFVPFQALLGPRGYLIEERGVSYAPSVASFSDLIHRQTPHSERLLALGDPVTRAPLPELPGAAAEVVALESMFERSTVLLHADATKGRLFELAPQSQVVHVAAHAEVDAVDPLYSIIHLAADGESSGALEAHEVYGMNLNETSLVSLSACETGRGTVTSGDEQWGFSRTFLAAGASALLVSLWLVDDEATRDLMTAFYRARTTAGNARALQAAQLSLLASSRHSDPLYWAGFNLMGNPY